MKLAAEKEEMDDANSLAEKDLDQAADASTGPKMDNSSRKGLDDAESAQTQSFSYESGSEKPKTREIPRQDETPPPPPPPPERRKVTMEEAAQGVYVPGEIEPWQTRMYVPMFHT